MSIAQMMKDENITLYTVLSYADVRETLPRLRTALNFVPKTVILFLLPYYTGDVVNLSRYAASKDYHLCIRSIGDRLIRRLSAMFPEASFHAYGDHSPIDERGAALSGGLGILGDNGLLITQEYGSYVFIGDILTDIPPQDLGAAAPSAIRFCEHCGKCSEACPTGILRGEGTDCLSAVTQRKGDLTHDEIHMMRTCHTVWGCDECQSHCPHNRHVRLTPIAFFYEDRIDHLTSEALAAMDDTAFSRRAFAWRGRKTIERNLCLYESMPQENPKEP